MRKLISILLLCGIIGIMISSCNKEESLDPSTAFLAKWDVIYSDASPTSNYFYFEFFQDSTMDMHFYQDSRTHQFKYWADTLLHMSAPEDKELIIYEFQYQFYGDTLELYLLRSTMFSRILLKRVE